MYVDTIIINSGYSRTNPVEKSAISTFLYTFSQNVHFIVAHALTKNIW